MKIRVAVAEEDILASRALRSKPVHLRPLVSESCPIAIAVQRLYPDATKVRVAPSYIYVRDRYEHKILRLDCARAEAFIRSFDAGEDVQPADFEIVGEI